MQLVIDIGNTNIVVGLFIIGSSYKEAKSNGSWRIHTDPQRTGDEYAAMLKLFLRDNAIDMQTITECGICSVVPILTETFATVIKMVTGIIPVIVGPAIYDQLPIHVPQTAVHEIGTDIICNAVGAFSYYQKACIAIDFGTALTFTAIDDTGSICGVAIAPGLQTAVKSLFRDTAQLPSVPLQVPPSSLGMNTVTSIQSGIVLGYTGLVESLVARLCSDLQLQGNASMPIPVIATGGLSSIMQPLTQIFDCVDINLTLTGLRCITRLFAESRQTE